MSSYTVNVTKRLDDHHPWLNLPECQQRSYNLLAKDISNSTSSITADTSPLHSVGFSQPYLVPELYDMRILLRDVEIPYMMKGSVSSSAGYSAFDNHHISDWLGSNESDTTTHVLQCDGVYDIPATSTFAASDTLPLQVLEASISTNGDEYIRGPYRDYAPYSYLDCPPNMDQRLEHGSVLSPVADCLGEHFNTAIPFIEPKRATRTVQDVDHDAIKAKNEDDEKSHQTRCHDSSDSLSVLAPISPSSSVHPRQRSSMECISELREERSSVKSQPRSQGSKPEWRVRELDGSDVLFKLDGIEFDSIRESYHAVSRPKYPNTCQEVCNGVVCGKRYQRREHLARHALSHSRIRQFRCKICRRAFSRNDNRNDHYWTHVFRPGTRSRNRRLSLQQVLQAVSDETPNVTARLIERWESEVLNVG